MDKKTLANITAFTLCFLLWINFGVEAIWLIFAIGFVLVVSIIIFTMLFQIYFFDYYEKKFLPGFKRITGRAFPLETLPKDRRIKIREGFRALIVLAVILILFYFLLFYLCLIFLFGHAYFASHILEFNILGKDGEPIEHYFDFLYFSTITVTTLGYGDLIPFGYFTKVLSIIEVSFGVIFITAVLTVALAFNSSSKKDQ